jgi:hypothetical protein
LGVIAVEMEGSGIADGAWSRGENYFLVRVICNYADQNKKDKWQDYAAVVAGANGKCIVDVLVRKSEGHLAGAKKLLDSSANGEKPRYFGHAYPVPLNLYNSSTKQEVLWSQNEFNYEELIGAVIVGRRGAGKSSVCAHEYRVVLEDLNEADGQNFPLFFDLEYTSLAKARRTLQESHQIIREVNKSDGESLRILAILDSLDQSD